MTGPENRSIDMSVNVLLYNASVDGNIIPILKRDQIQQQQQK